MKHNKKISKVLINNKNKLKMKKLVVLLPLFFVMTIAIAQSGKRDLNNAYNAYSNGYLDRALTAIERCIQAEDTKDEAKTWMYRGNIYLLIAAAEEGSEYKALSANPAEEAFDSYNKALALDKDISVSMRIATPIEGLRFCSQLLLQEAINLANSRKDNDRAFVLAEKAYKSNSGDDNIIYVYGYIAEMVSKTDIAKAAYISLVKKNSRVNPDPYARLANLYKEANDTTNALKAIERGEAIFLSDTSFNVNFASSASVIYTWANKSEKAATLMEKALQKDPSNHMLLINYGSELTNQKQYTEAEKYLLKALEIKADDIYANYNLGSCYYNAYVDKIKEIEDIEDNDLYNKELEAANQLLVKARPYLEKAHEIEAEDYNTLVMLKIVYTYLPNAENELKAVNEKIDALKKK